MHNESQAQTPASKDFQDPLIRPGINLQFVGSLALVALPLMLLFMVLSKEPNMSQQKAPLFKPVAAAQPAVQ